MRSYVTSFFQDSDFYNVSSLCLGTAVLLVWIGLLRFLAYSKKYSVNVSSCYWQYIYVTLSLTSGALTQLSLVRKRSKKQSVKDVAVIQPV